MSYAVRVSTLWIGQGQCNVIEVYKSIPGATAPFTLEPPPVPNALPVLPANSYLAFLAVVDLGSSKEPPGIVTDIRTKKKDGYYAISYIKQLVAFRRASWTPLVPSPPQYVGVIDFVYISHQDDDHQNLLKQIPLHLNCNATTKVCIEKIVIGGTETKYTADPKKTSQKEQELYNELVRANYHIYSTKIFNGAYIMGSKNPYVNDYNGDPDFELDLETNYKLRCNVLLSQAQLFYTSGSVTKQHSYFVNAGSIILLVAILQNTGTMTAPIYIPGFSALLTGDAIRYTFNKFLHHPTNKTSTYFTFSTEPKYETISHHGARPVIFDTKPSKDILKAFIENYKPHCAVVSAYLKHSHPNNETMSEYYNGLSNSIVIPLDPNNGIDHDCSTHGDYIKSTSTTKDVTEQGKDDKHYYRTQVKKHLYTTYNIKYDKKTGMNITIPEQFRNIHITCNSYVNTAHPNPIYISNNEFY